MGRLYTWVNILSIDVAIGASVSAWFLSRVLHVELFPQGLLALGVSVWIIYTADHLMDAIRVKSPASSTRHLFHQRNFRSLLIVTVVMILIDLLLVYFVRKTIITAGFFLSLLVVAYILTSNWLVYTKELAGALLYTSGVLLPSWTLHMEPFSMQQKLFILLFAVTVFTNLVLFSWLSHEQDETDGHKSIATLIGINRVRFLLIGLFVFFGILFFLATGFLAERVVVGLMMLVLLGIFLFRKRLRHDQFRWLGDGIFLLPLLIAC